MLAVLCAAQFMLIVDVVVVNVALPAIKSSLGIADARLAFVSIAYTLVFGSLLIVAGRAGDLFGRRRLLLCGLGVFTIGSLLSGVAQVDWQLFAARGVQGLGAAAVSPIALSLITATFAEGSARNRALGWWGAVGSAGAIAGQLLGGVLTDLAGWRSIFLINVPIGIAAIAIALKVLPESRTIDRPRLDLAGAVTLAAGLAALTYALSRLAEGGFDRWFTGAMAIAALILSGFVVIERRHPAPLMRFGLLGNRFVSSGNAILALSAAAVGGALFFTSLYLQLVLGYSPLVVGMVFAPVTLIVVLVSPMAGRLVERVGLQRLLVVGLVLTSAGLLGLAMAPLGGSLGYVLPALALVGLGSGLSYAPTFVAGTTGVADADQGLASGLLSTSQELGAAIGLALLGALATTVTAGLGLVEGYRAGYLGALAMIALALLMVPRIRVPASAVAVPLDVMAEMPAASDGNATGDACVSRSHQVPDAA
jgi:EmrB/QacA subfamily drug resistance transporter